ncbi:Excisionase-like protein [Serratia fonticola]|uniref:excisionase n=1 Tax=Serratia fonticola TaxID=47917 RepID=UPI0021826E95|nr:excisionase [Serratia fonticola]CAI2144482.1 Excisionase-like protein [Serratia fonticola]
MARMLPLHVWAYDEFGDAAPSTTTLQNYARLNMISPPAKKVGRSWMVEANARFIGILAKPDIKTNYSPLAKRILEDGGKTS